MPRNETDKLCPKCKTNLSHIYVEDVSWYECPNCNKSLEVEEMWNETN